MSEQTVVWRIYYANASGGISTFDNTEGEPLDAPVYGVLCIAQRDEDHNRMILTWNLYYWNPEVGRWFGADSPHDALQRLAHGYPIAAPKYGVTVGAPLMRKALIAANEDKDFPHQTGPAPLEHPKYLDPKGVYPDVG